MPQNIGNNQSFTSCQQGNDVDKDQIRYTDANDVQSAFIDKSAFSFLNSVSKSKENENR